MNTYYWWKEAGVCCQWEKEWQKHRLFPLGFGHKRHHMSLKWKKFPESWTSGSSEKSQLSNVGFYEVIRVGQSYSIPVCGSLIWQTSTGIGFPKSIFETFIHWEWKERRWAHRKGKKEKSSVQLSVDWKLLEINWTQTVRLGKDKQKEQGGRGSLHRQPQNIS